MGRWSRVEGTWREVICWGLLDWEGDAVVACSAFSRLRVQCSGVQAGTLTGPWNALFYGKYVAQAGESTVRTFHPRMHEPSVLTDSSQTQTVR